MTRLRHQLLSLLVILAMVVTMLPAGLASAAGEYFTFTNFSTNPDDPTQVNTQFVNLVGTFNGVSANSIAYQVDQVINGQVVNSAKGTGVSPIISNGNTFTFMNIQLFEGLNKITVSGTNPNGNSVPGVCYVNYSNVPVLYDVKWVDGRALQAGVPLVVDKTPGVVLLKAPNATKVTVNDQVAYAAGNSSFIVNNLNLVPGLNPLAIVASNSTMTYTLNRSVVYYNGYPTPYGTSIVNPSGTPTSVSLDNMPTVGPNNATGDALTGKIQGNLVFTQDNAASAPNISLELRDSTGTLVQTLPATTTGSPINDGTHAIYSYTTTTDLNLNTNDKYVLTVVATYGTQTMRYPLMFSYRNANTAYISDLQQIYNVRLDSSSNAIYTSSTVFPNNTMLFELPIWLKANIVNSFSLSNVTLSSTQNGQPVSSSVFTYEKHLTLDGGVAFKITNMPAGDQTLTITVTSGGGTETKTVDVNYIPAPFISLSNVFNTKVYNGNGTYPADKDDLKKFTTIKGRLVNFNTNAGAADLNSVQIKINGKSLPLNSPSQLVSPVDASGNFEWVVPDDMKLVNGPNSMSITGTANGVPVTITYTLYLFSDQVPVITSVKPVPYDPLSPQLDDTNLKFKNTGTLAYSTNEKALDVVFSVQNVDKVVINIDGVQTIKAVNQLDPLTGTNVLTSDDSTKLTILPTSDPTTGRYDLRLVNTALPKTGLKSIVIMATLDSSTVSQTLSITRELSPYVILSPKLPDEHVINQNFLNVVIQAEGADQVLLGKTPMTKDLNDKFRYELQGLKPGINTIKFTVMQGTQKLQGSFDVNYANSSTSGAEFKTTIPSNGTISVFNGDLSLKFPKGTLLRKANTQPGQSAPSIDLFDNQAILFGIADSTDGRTVQRYNDDGNLLDISTKNMAADLLKVPAHYGYASPLYWIDPGYFDTTSLSQYRTVPGNHPYMSGNEFYVRPGDKWMEPSQRGTITIKYDPYIRNVISPKLSVWRFHNNNWTNEGGVVDPNKHTVTASVDGFGYYAVFDDAYSFADIIGHPYARNSLELMFAKGIMLPKDNNEFGVYDNITRGEFATMMVKILDIPLDYSDPLTFDDVTPVVVPGSLWDYRYIETAVRKGIIRGLGPRVFAPDAPLTREQAAVMMARAMNLKLNPDPDKDKPNLQKSFTDANTVDYYAITSVVAVTKAGLITGRPNVMLPNQKKPTYYFDPTSYLNRADAAIIAEREMRQLKRI